MYMKVFFTLEGKEKKRREEKKKIREQKIP
jgi:hypothetical protein